MKKLMLMVATVAASIAANAAAVNWSSSSMTLPAGGAAGTAVTGYLFIVNEATYNTNSLSLSEEIYSYKLFHISLASMNLGIYVFFSMGFSTISLGKIP